MTIFRKLKTGTTLSWFLTNILNVIQICKQNENAEKKIYCYPNTPDKYEIIN